MRTKTEDRVFRPPGLSQRTQDADHNHLHTRGQHLLIIDYRDEVSARLMADCREYGIHVERVSTAVDAIRHCCRLPAALILSYRDLPDESGWLVASKLRLLDSASRIWLYAPAFSQFDRVGAEHSGIEDLIYYGGDLFRLSRQVTARLYRRDARMGTFADRILQDEAAQVNSHNLLLETFHSRRSVA